MFMASNQFRVVRGHEEAFESFWSIKQSSFLAAPGFISHRFTKGRVTDAGTTYMALTMWENEESFLAWRYGRGGDREWVNLPAPERKVVGDLDALISTTHPQ